MVDEPRVEHCASLSERDGIGCEFEGGGNALGIRVAHSGEGEAVSRLDRQVVLVADGSVGEKADTDGGRRHVAGSKLRRKSGHLTLGPKRLRGTSGESGADGLYVRLNGRERSTNEVYSVRIIHR